MSESEARPGADRPIEGLATAYGDRVPPPGLEDRVVSDLIAGGRLARSTPTWRTWSLRAAAAAVLFLAGWAAGSADLLPDAEATGATYMLLLWEDGPIGNGLAPGAVADRYAAWAADLAGEGVEVSGDELALDDRVVLGPGGAGDPPAPGARVGGYFTVRADGPDEARRIAESHPHVGYGGWIEVAPIVRR